MGDAALGHEPTRIDPIASAPSATMQRSSERRTASLGGSIFHRDKVSQTGIWNFASQPPHPRLQGGSKARQVNISNHEREQFAATAAATTPKLSSLPSRPWTSHSQHEVVDVHHQLQLAQAYSAGQRRVLHGRYSHGTTQASLATRTSTPPSTLETSSVPGSNSTSYIPLPRSTPRTSPLPPSSASYLPPDKSKALPPFSLHMGGMSMGGQVNATKPFNVDTVCTPRFIFVDGMRPAFSSLDRPLCQQGNLTLFARGTSSRDVEINFPGSLVSDTSASNLVCLRSFLILGWTIDWQTDQALLHTPDRTDTLVLPCVDGMYISLFIDPRYIQAGAAKTRQSPMTPPPPTRSTTNTRPSSTRMAPTQMAASSPPRRAPLPTPPQGPSLRPQTLGTTFVNTTPSRGSAPSRAPTTQVPRQASTAPTPTPSASPPPFVSWRDLDGPGGYAPRPLSQPRSTPRSLPAQLPTLPEKVAPPTTQSPKIGTKAHHKNVQEPLRFKTDFDKLDTLHILHDHAAQPRMRQIIQATTRKKLALPEEHLTIDASGAFKEAAMGNENSAFMITNKPLFGVPTPMLCGGLRGILCLCFWGIPLGSIAVRDCNFDTEDVLHVVRDFVSSSEFRIFVSSTSCKSTWGSRLSSTPSLVMPAPSRANRLCDLDSQVLRPS